MNLILSTVGTSILTNPITPEEKKLEWDKKLRNTANHKFGELPEDILAIINTLKDRALQSLLEKDTSSIRKISAELNGIYSFYQGFIEKGKNDCHILIATDTAQGQETASLVKEFLEYKGIKNCIPITPTELSTKNTKSFSEGVKDLIFKCEDIIPEYKQNKYKVIFNLVGGFKSLQGYMNTIGMFYADEIIYIFEGIEDELIHIPKLPVCIDKSIFEKYCVEFSLLAQDKIYPAGSLNIPETFIYSDGKDTTLSEWGLLAWNQVKGDLLSYNLL